MILPDKKLEQRISKFNKSEISNHFSIRQNFSLRLRKEKLDSKIMEKRISSISNTEYQVSKDLLILPDNFIEDFDKKENKLKFIFDILSGENKNIEILKFSLFYLREITSDLENETASIYEQELLNIFNYVTNLFFTSNDKQIKYESSWVLINLTFISKKCSTELLKEEYLTNLFYIMEKTEEVPLLNHVVFIISNILGEKSESQVFEYILKNHKNFLIRLKQLLKRESYSLGFKKILTWSLNNFVKGLGSINYKDFEDIISILIYNLKTCVKLDITDEEELLNDTLHCISQFEDENNEFIDKLIKEGLLNVLMSLYSNKKLSLFTKRRLCKVLGSLCSGSEEQLIRIIDSNILQSINCEIHVCYSKLKLLNDEDMKYLNESFLLIGVMISNYKQVCEKVFQGRLVELIKVITESVSNTYVKYEGIKIFTHAARLGTNKIWTSLIKHKIIHLALSCLKCYDNDLILICLECIQEFLTFSTKLNILNNIIKIDIENDEKFEDFTKLENSDNDEIAKTVRRLLSTFWKNDDMILDFK